MKMADGSIIVQGTVVQEGTSVWFSSRDKEKLATGLDRMAQQIKEQLGGEKPKLIFQFECDTRGKMMFREQEKLQFLRQFRRSVDPDVPWAGYYLCGGDWSGRGTQPSSSLHVGCPCPELTPESKERGGRGGRPQWRVA